MHHFVRDGLTFDVTDDGPADGRVVIALHGFPEDRHCWSGVIPQLTDAGYRVLAPDQRGYSPGARPKGRRAYALPELAADVLALADVAGAERFDVVGHDWGAGVAWELAARHPDRVRTMTSLTVPHPRAMLDSMLRSSQLLHSWYMLFFQVPWLPELAMRAAGFERAVQGFERDGLDPETARRYARRVGDPRAVTGPINWYRALPLGARSAMPAVSVPVLYVYADRDKYLTRYAAERTGRYVAGPYRYEVLEGMSHWLPTGAADRVSGLIREHLAAHPT
ncbi:MAG TPA: alpha/beta fold hydrolase [Acidimicrobiales bacterium]|nr:alpha/beta fold hydrolase [Acidimicrobiales bacterium]